MTLHIADENRIRTLTLNRPDALNAFNEALYDATADALLAAGEDPEVAVVVITGAGRAFSAGQDLTEMQDRITNPDFGRAVWFMDDGPEVAMVAALGNTSALDIMLTT